MKCRAHLAGAAIFALSTIGWTQTSGSSASTTEHHKCAQLRAMELDAHTPRQFGVLASYYNDRQTTYLAKAVEEKQLCETRSANITLIADPRNRRMKINSKSVMRFFRG
jgi:hypothetical protein